jgi:hypothetical protein
VRFGSDANLRFLTDNAMARAALVFRVACVALVVLGGAMSSGTAHASETDQFTLPPVALDDLGPDLSARTLGILAEEIAAMNERIEAGALPAGDDSAEADSGAERWLAERIFQRMGFGLPEALTEIWVRHAPFPGRKVRFLPSPLASVYAGVFSPFPLAFVVWTSPTIRLYGVDVGTDKVGHFFQQGAGYFDRYSEARASGKDEPAAVKAVVEYGVLSEATIFGSGLTGVYSNADLAADYAGFKFYRNLFRPVALASRVLPPMVVRDGRGWKVNPARADADLLRPYVSLHWNEAYNPSRYVYGIDTLRRHVRERCAVWAARIPDFDERSYRARLEQAKTWFGEPYGWDLPPEGAVSLLECFGPAPGSAGDRWLANSSRAIWLRCTSSGPSAKRSVRACA